MGVHKLNYIINKYNISYNDNLENIIKQIKKSHGLTNDKFIYMGIDTSLYINKIIHNNIYHKNEYIYFFFYQIQNLLKFKVIPLYIFDTTPSKYKKNELIKRNKNYLKNLNNLDDLNNNINNYLDSEPVENYFLTNELLNSYVKLIKLKKKVVKPTEHNYNILKKMLDYFSIPWLDADDEADFTLIKLYRDNKIHCILSDDNDFLLFNCNNVIKKNINSFSLVNSLNILSYFNINTDQFIKLCIRLGTEYNYSNISNTDLDKLLDDLKSNNLSFDKYIGINNSNDTYNIIKIIDDNINKLKINFIINNTNFNILIKNFNRNKLNEFINNIDL